MRKSVNNSIGKRPEGLGFKKKRILRNSTEESPYYSKKKL